MARRHLILRCFLLEISSVFSIESQDLPIGLSLRDTVNDVLCSKNVEKNILNSTGLVASSLGCKDSTPDGLGSTSVVLWSTSEGLGSSPDSPTFRPIDYHREDSLKARRIQQAIYFIGHGLYQPCLLVVCVVGNSLTLKVLHQGALKSSTSAFFMALAVSDILTQVTGAPYVIQAYQSVVNQPIAKSMIAFWRSYVFPFVYLFLTSSIWITVCLTTERFISVRYPIKAKIICTRWRAKMAVAIVFLASTVCNLPHFFVRKPSARIDFQTNSTYYESELTAYGLTPEINAALFWSKFIICVAIPFTILAVMNCFIIQGLRSARSFKENIQLAQGNDITWNNAISRDVQITRMLIGIVSCFFFSYTGSAVASLTVAISGPQIYADSRFTSFVIISNLISNTNSVLNFAMYTACSVSVRRAILQLLCPWRQTRAPQNVTKSCVTSVTGFSGIETGK